MPLYAVKASAIPLVLEEVAPFVDGFACSSVNELRLVHSVSHSKKLHFTTRAFVQIKLNNSLNCAIT